MTSPSKDARVALGPFVAHVIGHFASQIALLEPQVRRGGDPEPVHQMRVATRRLRADLSILGPVLVPAWSSAARAELGWLGGELGGLRDVDVLIERVAAWRTAVEAPDRPAVEAIVRRLGARGSTGQELVGALLLGDRYRALIATLRAAEAHPPLVDDPSDLAVLPARRVVRAGVRKRWHRLAEAVEHAGTRPSDADLHHVRILTKRCRYGVELAASLWPHETDPLARRLGILQTLLGDHHDTVVAEAWLREAARALPSCRLAAGILVAHEQRERARHGAAFPGVWAGVARPGLRRWLR